MTIVREIQPEELDRLVPLATAFYSSSKFLKGFETDRFCTLWEQLLHSGTGVIFGLIHDGVIVGALGGVCYPDLYSGKLIATEFFWFVLKEHRGGGVRLYKAFEHWSRERHCHQIRMVHLMDSMPEKLESLYKRWGFDAVEKHYAKELTW